MATIVANEELVVSTYSGYGKNKIKVGMGRGLPRTHYDVVLSVGGSRENKINAVVSLLDFGKKVD